jgi:hypothetical protein
MITANAQVHYDTELITTVISFVVQILKHCGFVMYVKWT